MFGWRKRKKFVEKSDPHFPDLENCASEQVTEAVTSTNTSTLGLSPALTIDQTMFAQSQAQGLLFANMVSDQQRQVIAGQVSAIKSAADIFGISPEEIMPSES